MEPNLFKLCDIDHVPEGEGRVVHAGTKKLALFRVEDQFYCIQNYCPHAGGFLGLGPLEGHIVRCPRHYWGFDIRDGACKSNGRYDVTTYPVHIQDGAVWVDLIAPEEPL